MLYDLANEELDNTSLEFSNDNESFTSAPSLSENIRFIFAGIWILLIFTGLFGTFYFLKIFTAILKVILPKTTIKNIITFSNKRKWFNHIYNN